MRLARAGRARTAPCSSRSSLPGVSLISVKVCLIPLLLNSPSCFLRPDVTLPPLSVFDRYSKYSKVDVAKAIDLEMKGDIESCLTAIGKTLR